MVRPDLHLPPSFVAWLAPFLAAFSRRTRPTAAALAAGALLAVGPRTVTNCLRALGLAEHPSFTAFHRVLNRNAWSGLVLARTLLHMAVAAFIPSGPIVIGIDHTLERRRGPHIGPAGRFPDRTIVAVGDGDFAVLELLHALRSSMVVITRMRKDARLFDPPPCHDDKPGRAPRKGKRQPLLSERLTDPATRWQRVVQASRANWRSAGWIEYTHGTALWHHGGKPIAPILWVLVRYPDGRHEPEAFLCTDTEANPRDVLDCYNRRWAVETTYEESRAHLGVETQRQWSDPAIFRTTPLLLGLYTVVTLYTHQNADRLALSPRRAAWYPKPAPTFADALARLRQHLWLERIVTSTARTDMTEPISPALQGILEAACYAP